METRIGVYLRRRGRSQLIGLVRFDVVFEWKSQGLELQKTFLLTTAFGWYCRFLRPCHFDGGNTVFCCRCGFEATSGLTTTGSTVLVVWMICRVVCYCGGAFELVGRYRDHRCCDGFLPELRVGGMQIFRAESFDTMGKFYRAATQISGQISIIYIGLTIACFLSYIIADMSGFDALIHALTTVATGGFHPMMPHSLLCRALRNMWHHFIWF